MMKTIAILLFSAFALTGCATDGPEVDQKDKAGIDDGTNVGELEPAVEEWLEAQLAKDYGRPVGLHGQVGEWAEELILGDKIYTLLHGPVSSVLLDGRGEHVVTIPCKVCERGL